MYRKALAFLLLMNLTFVGGYFSLLCLQKTGVMSQSVNQIQIKLEDIDRQENNAETSKNNRIFGIGMTKETISGERIVTVHVKEKGQSVAYTREEIEILSRIVEAEAGCEDEEGKLLVANVVLNRKNNDAFPDTIRGVVFQADNGVVQFSPVANGRFEQVKISEETQNAVKRALDGEDHSEGALYFVAREYVEPEKMKWFDDNLEFLFHHGGHEFFK